MLVLNLLLMDKKVFGGLAHVSLDIHLRAQAYVFMPSKH